MTNKYGYPIRHGHVCATALTVQDALRLGPAAFAGSHQPPRRPSGVSRAYRSLGLPNPIAANLSLRKRQCGFSESQMIESLSLLQAVAGECPEDIKLLTQDLAKLYEKQGQAQADSDGGSGCHPHRKP